MSKWISVKDKLPEINQAVLFVNDIRQNPQDKFIHDLHHKPPEYVSVRFGYVQELNAANPKDEDKGNHDNWFYARKSPKWWSVTGMAGNADHITHWMPLPEPPEQS